MLLNGDIFEVGLSDIQFIILGISVLILFVVSRLHERGMHIRERVNAQPLVIRWGIYIAAIWTIWVFGSYGESFDATGFIYGGF